jgi:hypothetical protein
MKRLTLALGTLALVLAVAGPPAPAQADWLIVRWADGDCKIWNDDGRGVRPLGPGWMQLNRKKLRTWDAAWAELGKLQAKKKEPKCRR